MRGSLEYRQSHKMIRLGLIVFVTIVLGTSGQIFAQEFRRDELFIIKQEDSLNN
ncbi:hypothetical protein RhiirA4_335480 [Rhizophagus irregularis]|nr:hypothetical protein RhiirA4_335480 [Rhizophagus irregularis]